MIQQFSDDFYHFTIFGLRVCAFLRFACSYRGSLVGNTGFLAIEFQASMFFRDIAVNFV